MNTIWAIFRLVAVLGALLFPQLASAGVPAPKAETRLRAIDIVVESGLKATRLCEAETRSAEAERAREVASRCSIAPRGGAGIPEGVSFEGTVHRAVNPKYADGAWDIHTGNLSASHRYSDVGRGGLYSGTSKEAVMGELAHYKIDPTKVKWVERNVKVDNVLDLTNPTVRKQLGIGLDDITGDSYLMTHALGDFARTRYSGILFPAARNKGTSHLVTFGELK